MMASPPPPMGEHGSGAVRFRVRTYIQVGGSGSCSGDSGAGAARVTAGAGGSLQPLRAAA
jgi:hypothetical protein